MRNTKLTQYPVIAYFVITYIISWLGVGVLALPKLASGIPIPKMDGLLMFPIMLIGPVVASISLKAMSGGKKELQELWKQFKTYKFSASWYALLLIPPVLILLVLLLLSQFISPAFKPNFFWPGILFGIPAGLFEEIGWTGFAMPKLLEKYSTIKTGIIIGVLWGCWHLPVIDFLGAATPHGKYLLPFFLSFILLLTGVRIIMTWAYRNTQSLLLVQLIHTVSTGCLAMLGPFAVSPSQETLWYFVYAVMMWIVVLILSRRIMRS